MFKLLKEIKFKITEFSTFKTPIECTNIKIALNNCQYLGTFMLILFYMLPIIIDNWVNILTN